MNKLTIAAIGCGARTRTYLSLASQMSSYYEIVAAADPVKERVERIQRYSHAENFRKFDDADSLLAEGKLSDIVVIGTQDAYHAEPCVKALRKGYDVLLEKPIATTLRDVLAIKKEASRSGGKVMVCHVLRYSPFYQKIKEIIDAGMIGEITCLNATEGVGPWHFAHSYVRGHWRDSETSSPIIIAKCCHDMDIISWLIGEKAVSVSSFGRLSFFNEKNAPEGAPKRCADGCPHGASCDYNALHYLGEHRDWLGYVCDLDGVDNDDAITASPDEIRKWLDKSDWGRCVFHSNNNVPDSQTVQILFEEGKMATFTMTAFDDGRSIEIFGTKGVLKAGGFFRRSTGFDADIIIEGHGTRSRATYSVQTDGGGYDSHSGGDSGLVKALYGEMRKKNPDDMRSSLTGSIESHVIGFAAEQSRRTGKTVDIKEFLEGTVKNNMMK